MKKTIYVSTLLSHIAIFHKPYIKWLQDRGYDVSVCGNNDLDRFVGLNLDCVDHLINVEFSRAPFSFKNVSAYKALKKVLFSNKYDIIICDTPVAGVLTRLCAKKLRKRGATVVYIAHGFHFYKGARKKNWLLYYPIEKILAPRSNYLVTINQEDFDFAKRKFKAKNILKFDGIGVNVNAIKDTITNQENLKNELGIPLSSTVITSIGEVNDNKNHEMVIRSLSDYKDKDFCYLIAGVGPLMGYIIKLSETYGIGQKVRLLGYRQDVYDILNITDIFCHSSFREGMSVSLMEAMASGLPAVVTDIRGNRDLIDNHRGGFVCDVKDVKGMGKAINLLIENKELRKELGRYNLDKIMAYDIEKILLQFKELIEKIEKSKI